MVVAVMMEVDGHDLVVVSTCNNWDATHLVPHHIDNAEEM